MKKIVATKFLVLTFFSVLFVLACEIDEGKTNGADEREAECTLVNATRYDFECKKELVAVEYDGTKYDAPTGGSTGQLKFTTSTGIEFPYLGSHGRKKWRLFGPGHSGKKLVVFVEGGAKKEFTLP